MDARRGLRWLRRLSSRGRPGQVSAGAGRLRARGAGLGAGRRGCGCARAGEALPAAPGPVVPGGAEDRGCAVRGVPGLQAGPRPQRLSVTGAFAEVGAAACAPGAEPPVRARPCSRPTPPVRSRRGGHEWPARSWRCTVQTANCSQAAGLPVTDATVPGPGLLLGCRSLEKGCAELRGGAGARLLQRCAAPAPRDSGSAGALALRLLSATWDAFR